jgi:hypothetical protein
MLQVIVGFLLILFVVIIFPLIPTSNLYGEWVTEKSRCTPNDILNDPKNDVNVFCKNGGTKISTTRCEPNQITGWGCKNISSTDQLEKNKTGRSQSFDTFVRREKCDIKCVRSKWDKLNESRCIRGTKLVQYVCIKNDPDGSNHCYVDNQNSRTEYKEGEIVQNIEPCVDDDMEIENGNRRWVLLVSEDRYSAPEEISNNFWNFDKILFTPKCVSGGPLEVGHVEGELGCSDDGMVYNGIEALRRCKNVPIPNRSRSISCVKVDYDLPFGIISDKNKKYIILSEYPDRVREGYQRDILLSFESINSDSACNQQEKVHAMAVRFYFVPVSKNNKNLYKIGLVATKGLLGWMSTSSGKPTWTQAKLGVDMSGLSLVDADTFLVSFDDDKVSIRGENGQILNIRGTKGGIILLGLTLESMDFDIEEFNNDCLPINNPYESTPYYFS